ncbi:MAG: hypothetical protein WBB81_11550, partial [Pyrinomonadaceae bacterium]
MHYDKFIDSEDNLELVGSGLKWYNLAKKDEPVPREIVRLAKSYLQTEAENGTIRGLGEMGFIILHRCG